MIGRIGLLGACLALPLAAPALAGQPSASQTITFPAGAVVLILPATGAMATGQAAPTDALAAGEPMLRLIAEQEEMMAEMNAAFAQPIWPQMDRAVRAAFGDMPTNAPGGGMVFTSMSGGPGVCSQRMTYIYRGNGTKPQVTMTRSGDACGAVGTPGKRDVMQLVPSQQPDAASPGIPSGARPSGPHLWTVSDPAREITNADKPRS
jgi:hypothetical protein